MLGSNSIRIKVPKIMRRKVTGKQIRIFRSRLGNRTLQILSSREKLSSHYKPSSFNQRNDATPANNQRQANVGSLGRSIDYYHSHLFIKHLAGTKIGLIEYMSRNSVG